MNEPRPEESGELMYIRCARCGCWMDVKPGAMNKVAHSLCDACAQAGAKRPGLDGRPGSGGAARP